MPSPTDGAAIAQAAIDTAGVQIEDTESLEVLINDIEIQRNRIKSVADKAQAGDSAVALDAVTVMRELHTNILPLLLDVARFTDRLEEHADWASQQIGDLQGETETASQLTSDDASQLRDFIVKVEAVLGDRAETLVPDSPERRECAALASRAIELVKLIDDVELTPDDDSDDDDSQSAPEPTPLPAIAPEGASPAGDSPTGP